MNTPTEARKERRPDWAALIIAAGMGVLAAVIWLDARNLSGGGYARIGPATFPKMVALGLMCLAVWTFIEGLLARFPEREKDELNPILWIVGGLVAQMLLISSMGFAVATGLLFATTTRAFGDRRLWLNISAGILLSFLIWLAFFKLLDLRLPAGPLERIFM